MDVRWVVQAPDPLDVQRLAAAAGTSSLVATCLWNRGIRTAEEARAYLEVRRDQLVDPERLPGVREAAERLIRAMRQDRSIVLYSDYDVDGVCGASVLWSVLRLAGCKHIHIYIPHRVDEGYGLNAAALGMIAERHPGALVVTIDCGITAVAEARQARALGLELVVTDHHHLGASLPEAATLVHPRLPGSEYPFPDLCGAGVAFKLAWQVGRYFGDGKRTSPALRDFLVRAFDLLALATVADVVPLRSENRIFVRHGLRGLSETAGGPGLAALLQVAGCTAGRRINSQTVSFQLAPRINAAGRMDRAMLAFELLTTESPLRAAELAAELEQHNIRRQEVERAIVEEARVEALRGGDPAGRASIVVERAGWHAGVVGIVAARLVDEFHRPSIVLTVGEGVAQGSGRSVPGLNLHEAIQDCAPSLITFGGHAMAAGLKLRLDRLGAFREQFEQACRARLERQAARRTLWIDAEVTFSVLSMRVVSGLEELEPYGEGNPRPQLLSEGVRIVSEPRRFGADQNHLRLSLEQGGVCLRGTAWRKAESWGGLQAGQLVDIVFEPRIDRYNGRSEVVLNLIDQRPHAT